MSAECEPGTDPGHACGSRPCRRRAVLVELDALVGGTSSLLPGGLWDPVAIITSVVSTYMLAHVGIM